MVAYIFTIGALNLLLGYLLAVYLRFALRDAAKTEPAVAATVPTPTATPTPTAPTEPAEPPGESTATSADEPSPDQAPEPQADDEADDKAEVALVDGPEEIPPQWRDRLAAESIDAQSLLESAARVLRLDVVEYRNALVELDCELRREEAEAAALQSIVDRLIELNMDWLGAQRAPAEHLDRQADSSPALSTVARRLGKALQEQESQIASTCNNLQVLDVDDDPAIVRGQLIDQLCGLIGLTHHLRDEIDGTLLAILHAEDRFANCGEDARIDSATGLHNMLGLELALAQWRADDPDCNRLASLALLDLAGVRDCNREHGARRTDRLIAAAARFLNSLLRKDRGMDLAACICGQQFLLFFGDTGPRGAASAVERVRQSFAAATFELGGTQSRFALSGAATEIFDEDQLPALLERLEKGLARAKSAGGDCTMIDEGTGPQEVDPPDYQIPPRVVPAVVE